LSAGGSGQQDNDSQELPGRSGDHSPGA